MRFAKLVVAVAAAAALGAGGDALAFMDTGTLLTNAASATYGAGGQYTSVSYSATAKILVANPAVFMWKDNTPDRISTAGGYTTYSICFSNGGANTAFKVTIKDRIPNNSYWVSYTTDHGFWSGGGSTNYASWGSGVNGPWTIMGVATPPAGQGSIYLQWQVGQLGIGVSGCIRFTLSIG